MASKARQSTKPTAAATPSAAVSDPRFQLLFEQNPVPLGVVARSSGQYLLCNAAAERLFGYAPGEMVGLDARHIIDASAHDLIAASLADTSREYRSVGTIPMRTKTGAMIWCESGFQRVSFAGEEAMIVTAYDATPRVLADRARQQSEQRFRSGFENAAVATLLLETSGRCVNVNAAGARLLGHAAEAVIGRPLLAFVDETDRDGLAALTRRLHPGAQAEPPTAVRLLRADGSLAWVRASIVALDTDDASAGFIAELLDETELHHAVQALRESEERLAFALDATTDGVWDWHLPTGRLVINARWSSMLGYEPGELEPNISTWEALSHPEDVPTAYGQLDAHAAGRIPQVEFEMRMRCKDGSWLWILNRAKIVARDAAGAPLRVVGTHSDIHERRAQDEALRKQAELLDTVLSNIPIALDIVGTDGKLEYVNAHMVKLLGWTVEDMAREDVFAAVFPDPAYRERAVASIVAASSEWQDWQLCTRDGRTITMSWSNVRLPDGRSIGIGTDVTALRVAEAEEERRAEQLQQAQKMESLGLLAGGIAHDFNNLLVGVLGNASLAEETLPEDAPARRLVSDVREAATRAADLTRQLLAYAGKGRFVVESVDVTALVGEMAALLRAAVSKRAVLRQDLATGLPGVDADATQLRQVVMNLITNASDALGDADGTISLRTFVTEPPVSERNEVVGGTPLPPGRYVCIDVEDTGAGMDAETVQRIFDPFFTTKRSGHGLGLAATLGIVRGHRGAIRVRSAVGTGTRVRVFLPATGAAIRSPHSQPAMSGAPMPHRGSGRVLLADDEPAVRDVARRFLERLGFSVVACADGAEAVTRFREDPQGWRVVLLDLTMPGMGGEDALLAIRAIRPDMPAVLASGYASQQLSAQVTALPAVTFVQKPFTVSTLTRAVFDVCPPEPPADA